MSNGLYGVVELVLHIGMGKTGTTSIQRALDLSGERLFQKSTEYLGMWFDLIDPRFRDAPGQEIFANSPAEQMQRYAETFAARLDARSKATGATRFILSNENIFGLTEEGSVLLADRFAPFVEALRRHVDVRIVVYVRDPYDWLPSAYNQWGVYHKTDAGPIKPYASLGRELIGSYAGLLRWHHHHPDILQVRRFSKTQNVVEDFSSVINVALEVPENRDFERVSVAESIIRHVYNSRYEQEVLPDRFDSAIGGGRLSAAPRIGDLMADSFCYRETLDIVSENAGMFFSIRREIGLDLLSEPHAPTAPNEGALRDRVVEQLVYLVVEQADRITALEKAHTKLPGPRFMRFLLRLRASVAKRVARSVDRLSGQRRRRP